MITQNFFVFSFLTLPGILATFLVILLTYSVVQRFLHFRTFSRQGISGPSPSFWTGNLDQLRPIFSSSSSSSLSPITALSSWSRQYGKVFGYFSGSRPILVISDLDLVQEILVKKSKQFRDRPPLIMKLHPIPDTLVGLRGEKWASVRNALSPIFSPPNIRTWAGGRAQKCVEIMGKIVVKHIKGGESVEIDVWKLFQGLTCDVIARSALAMKTNSQQDPDDEFLKAVQGFLGNALHPGVNLALCFPILAKVIELGLSFFGGSVSNGMTTMIVTSVRRALEERRKKIGAELEEVNVLQLMLDSGKLSDPEIIGNAWVFILGGFETTASALTFSTFLLAKHQSVQDKLWVELEGAFGEDEIPSYTQIQKLDYLDHVVSECLRLYPPIVTFISRHVEEDLSLSRRGSCLNLKKGWTVQIPIWEIHHDPTHYPGAETFRPERFTREEKAARHPMAYLPFGAGPRSCIGARFAVMELKIGLAHIFRKFRVKLPRPDFEPKLAVPTVTIVPADGELWLTFSLRRNPNNL